MVCNTVDYRLLDVSGSRMVKTLPIAEGPPLVLTSIKTKNLSNQKLCEIFEIQFSDKKIKVLNEITLDKIRTFSYFSIWVDIVWDSSCNITDNFDKLALKPN